MPELPEVETTRRGIEPFVTGRLFTGVRVREARLRWPVARDLAQVTMGRQIEAVRRRGKYLLLETAGGALIVHLGMSGSLRLAASTDGPGQFDHLDVLLDTDHCLRFRDPRRFGCVLWTEDPERHPLLRFLGPEPLDGDGQGQHLYEKSRGRRRAVRDFLLDGRMIAGIGNIYANEALFAAGVDPRRAAGRIARSRYERLGRALQHTLREAIKAGGTTLRDFRGGDGRPGYFQRSLKIYGRHGAACRQCGTMVRSERISARSAFFCPQCQS